MTASKSSRARAARAQASAARNGGGTASNGSGTARNGGRNGAAAKSPGGQGAGTAVAVKTQAGGTAVKTQAAGNAAKAQTAGGAVKTQAAGNGAKAQAAGGAAKAQAAGGASQAQGVRTRTMVPLWLQLATFVLALAGLAVSVYLTIAHFTEKALFACAESGIVNCTKVTTSPQSYVFGIPVAVLGLAFYVTAVALMSPWAWRSTRREVHLIRLASVVVGIGFVVYLLYAELFIIGSICLYCTSVHVITFALFVLTAFAAAAWGVNPTRPAD